MEEKTEENIELTLDPGTKEELPQESPAAADGKFLKDVVLSEEEQKTVDEFASRIDLSNSAVILEYGAAAQKKTADFSDSALQGVKAKDLGEVGDMITDLVAELKEGDSVGKGFLGIFKKAPSIEKLKARYEVTEKNVDKVSEALIGKQNTLTKDSIMLDELYKRNLSYYKELTMYILAGRKAMDEAKTGKLAELQKKATESGLPEDAQAASDFGNLIDRFEKKLYDLELTRTISMQMAPQIRLLQNNDILMVERIQSTVNNTIPLWKNQLVLTLGLAHSQEALKAEKAVTDLTNELLKKNAETLKQGTIEIAKESERGIVDMETLKETNTRLIESLTEVTRIQEEGRIKRASAENELGLIEQELRAKLLEMSKQEIPAEGV